jgi:sulfur-oxidizing protein SoxY
MKRRSFLQGTLAIAAGAGLLRPFASLASVDLPDAFAARSEADVLMALFGSTDALPGKDVRIEAPVQSMQDKATPIKVWCDLDEVTMIAIVTRRNPFPLNTYIRLFAAAGYYSTRIRLEQSSLVTAYVQAGGQVYSAAAQIKVTQGGYGMHVD